MRQMLAPTRDRWRRAFKIAVTVAVAGFVGWIVNGEQAVWAMLTVLILSTSNVGATWKKAGERVIGTVAAVGACVVVVAVFPQSQTALLLMFGLGFLGSLYLSYIQKATPYAFYLGAVTVVIVMSPAWENPAAVPRQGLQRLEEILIGVVVTAVMARLLWPVSAEAKLYEQFVGRLERIKQRLARIDNWLSRTPADDAATAPEPRAALSDEISLLAAATAESSEVRKRKGAWLGRITLINRMASQAQALEHQMDATDWGRIPESLRSKICVAVKQIQAAWTAVGEDLLAGRTPSIDAEQATQLADELQQLRDPSVDAYRLPVLTTVIVMLKQIGGIGDALAFQQEHADTPLLGAFAEPTRRDKRFFHYDRLAWRTSVKATIAVMIATTFVATMHWTGAIRTTGITALLLMQPTIGASWNKSIQRTVGVLIGSVYGVAVLATVSASTNDVWWVLVAIFIGAFVAGWLMAGPWETSYIGMQVGIAVVLVLGEVGPSTSVAAPIGRVTGILIGTVIALCVLRLLWPVWARRRLCESLRDAASMMAEMLEVGLRTPEEEAARRPTNGWSYQVQLSISEAFRYREEARYERGISPSHAAPSMHLASLLQDTLPRIVLVIHLRWERKTEGVLARQPEIAAMRRAIEQRLQDVAKLVVGDPVEHGDLRAPLADVQRVYRHVMAESDQRSRSSHAALLAYYEEFVPILDDMVEAARETAAMFLSPERPGTTLHAA